VDDAAAFAGAAVFGGEQQLDAARAKEIEIEELGGATCSVEEHRPYAARLQRFGEGGERRQADTAGYHPRLRRRIDRHERTPERTETRDALAWSDVVEKLRRDADAFIQQRQARRRTG